MIQTRGITHINLAVRDLHKSEHFYTTVFGMEVVYRTELNAAFLRTPGTLDLLTLDQNPENVDLVGNSAGIDHWGFIVTSVDQLENAKQEVEAAGGKYLRSTEPVPGVPDVYLEDPDGYVIQLFFDPTQ